jgi:Tfp pilus assembly protein PilN
VIRINLLGQAGSSQSAVHRRASSSVWLVLVGLMIAALGLAQMWRSVRADVSGLGEHIAAAEREVSKLRADGRDITALQLRKNDLAGQLARRAAEDAARTRPVRLLAAVGRSVSDEIWLTTIRQQGVRMEIDGRARSVAAVTAFAERIHVAGVLTTPVEIVSTSAESREPAALVRFSLRLD